MTEIDAPKPRKRSTARRTAKPSAAPEQVAEEPRGLVASDITATAVTLTWPQPDGWVELQRDGKALAVTAVSSYRDDRVKPGSRYEYRMRQLNGKAAPGEWSPVVTVGTPEQ